MASKDKVTSRARSQEGKQMGRPEGAMSEVNFPRQNPGDVAFQRPGMKGPNVKSNQ